MHGTTISSGTCGSSSYIIVQKPSITEREREREREEVGNVISKFEVGNVKREKKWGM